MADHPKGRRLKASGIHYHQPNQATIVWWFPCPSNCKSNSADTKRPATTTLDGDNGCSLQYHDQLHVKLDRGRVKHRTIHESEAAEAGIVGRSMSKPTPVALSL